MLLFERQTVEVLDFATVSRNKQQKLRPSRPRSGWVAFNFIPSRSQQLYLQVYFISWVNYKIILTTLAPSFVEYKNKQTKTPQPLVGTSCDCTIFPQTNPRAWSSIPDPIHTCTADLWYSHPSPLHGQPIPPSKTAKDSAFRNGPSDLKGESIKTNWRLVLLTPPSQHTRARTHVHKKEMLHSGLR